MTPERVSLAEAYYHFRQTAPSDRKAAIDLIEAIRNGLDLRADVVKELIPGKTDPKVTHNQAAIDPDALADRTGMSYDFDFSKATWQRKSPQSWVCYEGITVSKDRLLAARAAPVIVENPECGSDKYDWESIATEFGRRVYLADFDPIKVGDREAARQMLAWCETKFGKQPAESTMREHVSGWLKQYKK